jgi:cytochrome c-type biogenesis protein CcmF
VLAVQASIAVAFISLHFGHVRIQFLRIPEAPFGGPRSQPHPAGSRPRHSSAAALVGYVGLSISFSFAHCRADRRRIEAAWARWVRPWTLLAWMFLTLGIADGS